MGSRRGLSRAFAALLALGGVVAVASCGAAPPTPLRPPSGSGAGACDGARLEACEGQLASARRRGVVPPELVGSYVGARAAREPHDGWARLSAAFDALPKGGPRAVVVLEPGAPVDEARRASAGAGLAERVVPVGALPEPAAIDADELLLVLAEAAGLSLVVRVGPGSVTELVPADPLGPFLAELPAVAHADDTLAHLRDDLALEQTVRAALDAAGASRYADAAQAADRLAAAVASRPPFGEPVLRARYALQLLGAAGLVLDPEVELPDAPPAPALEAPPPAPGDTPYGDLLRVRLARDDRAEWAVRRATLLRALPADRRDDFDALFAKSTDCSVADRVAPMEGPRDLAFASKLAGSLATAVPGGATARGLPLAEWLARYDALVQEVEGTHTGWAYVATLLYQRGESPGLRPAGTSSYRRVTELARRHLAAARALEEAYPARYQALSLAPLAFCPGLLGDDPLRESLLELSRATVQEKLARASDPGKVMESVVAGVLSGMSYPPALQSAHFLALQGAATAKLHGDLLKQTGWGVAGLYAADGAFRLATDQPSNLGFSTSQVARALADPAIERPDFAALATAAARYAGLAVEHRLAPAVLALAHFPPDRRAARDALRSAVAGLGEPGEAPNNVLDDVTELADGLLATLSVALAEPKRPAPAGTCATRAVDSQGAPTRRALAKLGDVRLRILGHPRYKNGDGLWVRRVRLLVTALSDAMDLAQRRDKLAFTIPAETGERNVAGALREWGERGAADAVAAAYRLARGAAVAKSPEDLLQREGGDLRRVLTGVLGFFRSDPSTKGTMGVALLDTLATLPLTEKGEGLNGLLLSYAAGFYGKKQQDQGDLWLLASLTVDALTGATPSPEATALAAASGSRLAWVMRFLGEVSRAAHARVPPDGSVYASDLRKATDDSCATVGAGDVLEVTQAVHDFAGGKPEQARAALDRVLARADEQGLTVPRMVYKYEEKTATKVFSLMLDVSYAAGFLEGARTFQVGVGVRTRGEPEGSLTAKLSTDPAKSGEDAARYYVRTAALAAAYHFVDGDLEHAVRAAQRAVAALASGVRLGARALHQEKAGTWGHDAAVLLALDAQLAADAGMPLLAGDLWTVVRKELGEALDDRAVADFFASLPAKLGSRDLRPLVERAARSFKVLAAPLPCTDAKVELGAYEQPACDAYPLALSLRVADVLKKLPRLKHGSDAGPHCAAMRSLDAFLGPAEKGMYDPDAFTRAVEELRAAGLVYDAGVLLARQKRPEHCSPALLAASRQLGRSPLVGPLLRSDLLASAVNCAAGTLDAAAVEDLLALDADTRRLPDLGRNLKLMLSVADLAARHDRWDVLSKLAARPAFVEQWMSVNPLAAAAALLVEQATTALSGDVAATERLRPSYQLLCETFPPGDRAEVCALLKALRESGKTPDERRALAKESVKKLVAAAQAPGPAVSGRP